MNKTTSQTYLHVAHVFFVFLVVAFFYWYDDPSFASNKSTPWNLTLEQQEIVFEDRTQDTPTRNQTVFMPQTCEGGWRYVGSVLDQENNNNGHKSAAVLAPDTNSYLECAFTGNQLADTSETYVEFTVKFDDIDPFEEQVDRNEGEIPLDEVLIDADQEIETVETITEVSSDITEEIVEAAKEEQLTPALDTAPESDVVEVEPDQESQPPEEEVEIVSEEEVVVAEEVPETDIDAIPEEGIEDQVVEDTPVEQKDLEISDKDQSNETVSWFWSTVYAQELEGNTEAVENVTDDSSEQNIEESNFEESNFEEVVIIEDELVDDVEETKIEPEVIKGEVDGTEDMLILKEEGIVEEIKESKDEISTIENEKPELVTEEPQSRVEKKEKKPRKQQEGIISVLDTAMDELLSVDMVFENGTSVPLGTVNQNIQGQYSFAVPLDKVQENFRIVVNPLLRIDTRPYVIVSDVHMVVMEDFVDSEMGTDHNDLRYLGNRQWQFNEGLAGLSGLMISEEIFDEKLIAKAEKGRKQVRSIKAQNSLWYERTRTLVAHSLHNNIWDKRSLKKQINISLDESIERWLKLPDDERVIPEVLEQQDIVQQAFDIIDGDNNDEIVLTDGIVEVENQETEQASSPVEEPEESTYDLENDFLHALENQDNSEEIIEDVHEDVMEVFDELENSLQNSKNETPLIQDDGEYNEVAEEMLHIMDLEEELITEDIEPDKPTSAQEVIEGTVGDTLEEIQDDAFVEAPESLAFLRKIVNITNQKRWFDIPGVFAQEVSEKKDERFESVIDITDDMVRISARDLLTGELYPLPGVTIDAHGILTVPETEHLNRGEYDVVLEIKNILTDDVGYLSASGLEVQPDYTGVDADVIADQEAIALGIDNVDIQVSRDHNINNQLADPSQAELQLSVFDPGLIRNTDTTSAVFAFDFGIYETPIVFNEPVEVTVAVWDPESQTQNDPLEISVRVQHEGDVYFDDQAVSANPDASCGTDGSISDPAESIMVDEAGTITFYTCQTSTYLGTSTVDPAGSCWEIKQRDDTSTDGVYFIQTPAMATPTEFYCDMTYDGGGWVLVGRGRDNWAWADAGAGTAASIRTTPTGTGAFTPAYLPSTDIDDLMNGGDVSELSEGIRLNRTEDNTGTTFQDFHWFLATQTNWDWDFDAGFGVDRATWDSAAQGTGQDITADDTADYNQAGNTILDVETNTLAAPANTEGFAYGTNLFGGTGGTDWGYQTGTRSTIPFTQVYIRPQITRGPVITPDTNANGPMLWLDASDIDGDSTANSAYINGDVIDTWSDKSTNGFDFTASGAGVLRPTLNTTGFNGLPSVQIDETQQGLAAPAGFSSISNDYSVFAVVQQDDGGAGFEGSYFYDQNVGSRLSFQQGNVVTSDALFYDGADGPTGFGDNGSNMAAWIFDFQENPSFVFRRNGAQITTDATGYDTVVNMSNDATIGERYATPTVLDFDGQIAEIIIYDRVLSDNEINLIERYLDCKWSVTARTDCDYQFTVYQNVAAGPAVGTTTVNMTWADVVLEASDIARQANVVDFELTEGGHYLVMYSLPFVDTGGANRSEIQSWLRLDNTTDLEYGAGLGFIRRNNGDNDAYLEGAAILDVPPQTDVRVQAQRTDSNTSTVQRTANRSGINILKLDDEWDYARIRPTASQNVTSAWTTLDLTTEDELDSTGYSRSGSSLTLKNAGHYLVTYNVAAQVSGTVARNNNESRLMLDGVEIDATRSETYIRHANGADDGIASYVGVIETASNNQVLEIEFRNESSTNSSTHTTRIDRSGLTIVKLPDTADYVRLGHTSGGQSLTTAANTAITWNETLEEDASSFDHDAVNTEFVNIEQDGDYLFFHSMFNSRTPGTSNGPRESPFIEWEVNGTELAYGNSGSFNRQSNDGAGLMNSSHSSAGLIIPNMVDTDRIELVETNEASAGASTYRADRMGLQGIHIGSLFNKVPNINQLHFRWRDDTIDLNTTGGWLAAEDVNLTTGINREDPYRLRFEVANTGGLADDDGQRTYQLQWVDATSVGGVCASATGWADAATATDAWEMVATANIDPDGEAATSGLLANSDGYTFINGEGRDTASTTGLIGPLDVGEYTELEYSLQATDYAVTGHTYCFRLFDDNNSLTMDTYSGYPSLMIKGKNTGSWGEAGTVASPIDGGWHTLTYAGGPYTNPVVVGSTNTQGGDEALVFEARNVGTTTAEIRLCDSNAGNGTGCQTHISETMAYVVVDIDQINNIDGIEAGTVSASGDFAAAGSVNVAYTETFTTAPYVFLTTQTDNGPGPIVGRLTATSTGDFDGGICQQNTTDGCDTGHVAETLGWVAVDPSANPFGLLKDTATGATAAFSGTWTSVVFTTGFTGAPVVISQNITHNGAQDVMIDEVQSVTSTGMDYRSCELDDDNDCDNHATDTVAWLAIEPGLFMSDNAGVFLDQTHYRWYENNDTVDPTVAYEAENTTYSGVDTSLPLRLRMLLQNGVNDLTAATIDLKLQYGLNEDCTAVTTWTDVDAPGGTSDWVGYDNTTPTDGTAITSSLLFGGGHTLQSYEEDPAGFNNNNAMTTGTWNEFDYALFANDVSGGNYCFRVVTDQDQEICYTEYAQIETASFLSFNLHSGDTSGTGGVVDDDDQTNGFNAVYGQTVDFGMPDFATASYGTGTSVVDVMNGGSATSNVGDGGAHGFSVETNADDGFITTVWAYPLRSPNGDTITAINGGTTEAASAPGTEQFGLCLAIDTTGTYPTDATDTGDSLADGIISTGFDCTNGHNLNETAVGAGTPVLNTVAESPGSVGKTFYDVEYLLNIGPFTESGLYSTDIVFTTTASF